MSGQFSKCGEHDLECVCKPLCRRQEKGSNVSIDKDILMELIFLARRIVLELDKRADLLVMTESNADF